MATLLFSKGKRSLPRTCLWLWMLAGMMFFVNVGTAADEDDSPQAAETVVEAGEEQLLMFFDPGELVVTTGASRPLAKKKMPATVTVITAEEIKLLGLRHLTDVVNYIVPGGIGDIHRSSRTGLYNFRGITADDNGKFVFLVDGHNATSLGHWGAFNERYLGLLDELDRIEITQGVGSTLYGSGATSGVINFITKTGRDFQGTEIYTGYGRWEKQEYTAKIGEKLSEQDHSFYYFGYKQSHGETPGGGSGDSYSGYGRKEHSAPGRYWDNFEPSFKLHANIRRGDFTLRARYVRSKFEEPYTSEAVTDWNTSDEYWFHNYFFIEPEINRQLDENSRLRATLSFGMDELGEERAEDWIRGGNLNVKAGDRRLSKGERKLRGRLFYYYDGLANHKLTAGTELFWMHVGPDFSGRDYTVKNNGDKVSLIKRENLYFVAGFIEDIWRFDDKTTVFAGVRVENHNLTPVNISPRVAVSHDLNEKTNLKFMFNTGFRTPPWGYYWANMKKPIPAEKPDQEKVRSFEAHLLHKFNPNFDVSLVGYYTIYKDLINFWSSSFDGPSAYYNFKEVRSAGLEFAGDYHTDKLKLKFSHSFSRPEHFSGQPWSTKTLDNEHQWEATMLSYNLRDWAQFPTHLTKAQAIVHLIKDKLILGVTYLRPWGIRGQRNADPKIKDASNYVNATLTYKVDENFEVQLSGYNLTEEDNPWWGAYTYDGVSRDVNYHAEYFVRLIWRF